jgi:hypothetical protein
MSCNNSSCTSCCNSTDTRLQDLEAWRIDLVNALQHNQDSLEDPVFLANWLGELDHCQVESLIGIGGCPIDEGKIGKIPLESLLAFDPAKIPEAAADGTTYFAVFEEQEVTCCGVTSTKLVLSLRLCPPSPEFVAISPAISIWSATSNDAPYDESGVFDATPYLPAEDLCGITGVLVSGQTRVNISPTWTGGATDMQVTIGAGGALLTSAAGNQPTVDNDDVNDRLLQPTFSWSAAATGPMGVGSGAAENTNYARLDLIGYYKINP